MESTTDLENLTFLKGYLQNRDKIQLSESEDDDDAVITIASNSNIGLNGVFLKGKEDGAGSASSDDVKFGTDDEEEDDEGTISEQEKEEGVRSYNEEIDELEGTSKKY